MDSNDLERIPAPLALVVDDEPLIRMDTAAVISDAGFHVIEVSSADEAYAFIESHSSLKLLFTDVRTGGEMDGFELARKVALYWPAIEVVIASGECLPKDGDLIGNASFVRKPFSTQMVLQALEEHFPKGPPSGVADLRPFETLELRTCQVAAGPMRFRMGGSGPPILLLHGHPRTHMTWAKVADRLGSRFTVVCPDIPGFGQSYIPKDASDSVHSSKRAKAAALVELMQTLKFEKFGVVGHDRGSLVAFRMALDHRKVVERLIVVDGLPVLEHLERADWKFARDWYHWFFFAQPEKPEKMISADPEAWYDKLSPALMGQAAYADIRDAIHRPEVIHGMVEDYRAGLRIDHIHDKDDRDAGRKVLCPMLCLWSLKDDLGEIYGDPVAIWKNWATDVHGYGIDSGHHVAEENPEKLANAIADFLQN